MASENRTEDYIRRVCDLMSRDPLSDYKLYGPYTERGVVELGKLVCAMTCVETGCPYAAVPVEDINAAFRLPGLKDPRLTKDWWK